MAVLIPDEKRLILLIKKNIFGLSNTQQAILQDQNYPRTDGASSELGRISSNFLVCSSLEWLDLCQNQVCVMN